MRSGVLKIEPSSVKRAICYSSKDRPTAGIYDRLSNLLQANKRREAIKLATKFIDESLSIDRRLSIKAETVYEELLSSRKKRDGAKVS